MKQFIFIICSYLFLASCTSYAPAGSHDLNYFKSERKIIDHENDTIVFDLTESPSYGIGDGFLYDSGRIEFVANTNPLENHVVWHGGKNFSFITGDAAFPLRLAWKWVNGLKQPYATTVETNAPANFLWPLRVGDYANFNAIEENTSLITGKTITRKMDWRCSIPQTEQITVPAGTFDTFKLVCDRLYKSDWKEAYVWYYAPTARYWVKRIYKYRTSGDVVTELVSFGPMPNQIEPFARERLKRLRQHALESRPSGESSVHLDPETGIKIEITPTQTWHSPEDIFCRAFTQKLSARGRTSTQHDIACRNQKGEWKKPNSELQKP